MIEHERKAASWRSEWRALPEACMMAGALLAETRASGWLD